MLRIKILVTLGPSSLNSKFLKFSKGNVDLLRLNLSHINSDELSGTIDYIRKYNKTTPICIDTEGAQIRTKFNKKFLRKNQTFKINLDKKNSTFYPSEFLTKIKLNDIFLIGFENLEAKVKKINEKFILLKVLQSGYIENNKGVHLKNRKVNLNFLTKKDNICINIAKKKKINNFALSFTNSSKDVINFRNLLPKTNRIFKIETLKSIQNLKKIIKYGDNFLIDRGDLSKDVTIEKIPYYQREIIKTIKKCKGKKNIYIATNLLESMVNNPYPNRAETNDIYNCLEMGATGLVLAAETAIGKHPIDAVIFLKKMIRSFKTFGSNK